MPDEELLSVMESASDSLREAERLKYRILRQQGPPKCEIINKIYCHDARSENLYLDEPWVVESGPFHAHLRGSHAVPHLELHLERNKEITFIVYRHFECCGMPPPKDFNYYGPVRSSLDSDPSGFLKSEYISLVSEELSEGLRSLAEGALDGIPHPKFNRRFDDQIIYPYLWWYHRRHEIEVFTEALQQEERKHLAVFQQYIQERLASDWSLVDALLGCGRITAEYIQYLFADSRFMVDYRTYSQMHPPEGVNEDSISPDISHDSHLDLDGDFFKCLPATIPGFNMQKKEWVNLDVEFIEDVEWNDQAFEHLVIDTETKELVKAVVTTQLRAEENTDLIRGKGNGLFILLHGGPGTGKTLTAESVAEIAKKPLYRVTCGDIGTRAEEVEKYLDTVLLLGKTWGCVVLLDEADVFLEERTLKNLERNALVSVFLRVLEYYDGILILTSNRVGTFDEAFKSRIQLNLRYKNLNEQQRLQIWTNFIDRIEKLDRQRVAITGTSEANSNLHQDIGINSEEIRAHLPKLAMANLNGREIRNAISTARQLAVYRGNFLGYEHIACVIGEARGGENDKQESSGIEPKAYKMGLASGQR
ncbi:hypothetical protein CGLO_08551 [Colletotrichum gloeosporioides Cg-14]|uniref:AAA+ ATPase domain-containing protein n=1 Tax=Colletotrichum gloeosporioides (strain Cg-14) TaxID=1237896 RepID=T0KFV2_COLGC|nr:hypothetical protein CGLO_08551 [Colletotrichum gloeosporioides Cg-14]